MDLISHQPTANVEWMHTFPPDQLFTHVNWTFANPFDSFESVYFSRCGIAMPHRNDDDVRITMMIHEMFT